MKKSIAFLSSIPVGSSYLLCLLSPPLMIQLP